ncbi:MAG: S9 family peptidase [Chloroflexi bacterium]|nr:S9 family peptidase [Chloroflexota bacterium]
MKALMRRSLLLLILALLIALPHAAGRALPDATPIPTPTTGATITPAVTATPVPTPTPAGTLTPTPTATPSGPQDGMIDSITLVYSTNRSVYYAITYWSDGLRVAGYLGYPSASGIYPAIIHNRGGFGSTGALTGGEIVPYVEAGYVAVASQYRGNGGGEGHEDFGGADVHDVLNLIPLLQSLPNVDPDRIGMFGGSRGGMMAYIALREDALSGQNAIKAAVTVGGISDLFAWDQERGGSLAGILWLPLVGATPTQNPALYRDRSAVYWADLIQAPILLLHGDADQDVSVQQTYWLAAALETAGATVKTIIFPGGDHPLSRFDGGYRDTLAWFDKYLGADGIDRSFATHEQAIRAAWTWFGAQ